MQCVRCKKFYDLLCANFTNDNYLSMSTEFRKNWICVECRSKIPKGDNSGTPVRQVPSVHDMSIASDCADISMCSMDHVTVRVGARYNQTTLNNANDTMDGMLDTIRTSVAQELKDMQSDLESRLMARISKLLLEHFANLKSEVLTKVSELSKKIADMETKMDSAIKLSTLDQPTPLVPGTSPIQAGGPATTSGLQRKQRVSEPRPPAPNKESSSSRILQPTQNRDTLVSVNNESNGGAGEGEWTEVRNRRSRNTSIRRGTAAPGTTTLEASERRRFLHLYYVKEGTSDRQVLDHLNKITKEDNSCTVEVLKSRGNYASFKIGAPSRLADVVLDTQNWAADICIKPWRQNFRRGRETGKAKET